MAGSKNLWVCFPPYKDVTDFPSLISGVHMPDLFWDNVEADGADIIAYNNAGTKLKRELVSIDTVGKTQELYVKCSRSATSPTYVRINYDDAGGAETNDTDTWVTAFKMVHHMNDDPDNTAIADSTVNANDGAKGAAGVPAEAVGAFDADKAQDFGGADYISVAAAASLRITDEVTLSGIYYFDAVSSERVLIDKYGGSDYRGTYALAVSADKVRFVYRNAANTAYHTYTTTGTISTGQWYHIAAQHEYGVGANAKIFINGVEVAASWTSGDGSDAPIDVDSLLYIGAHIAQAKWYLDGKNSEVRIVNDLLSPDWIAAEYRNLLDNANDHYVMPIYNNHIRTNNLPGKLSALGY